jgi:hypothetical protein
LKTACLCAPCGRLAGPRSPLSAWESPRPDDLMTDSAEVKPSFGGRRQGPWDRAHTGATPHLPAGKVTSGTRLGTRLGTLPTLLAGCALCSHTTRFISAARPFTSHIFSNLQTAKRRSGIGQTPHIPPYEPRAWIRRAGLSPQPPAPIPAAWRAQHRFFGNWFL